jgi:hypothetical protein
MNNQPFAVPGQRVRWAVAELRKAGIDASVQRGPGGAYYITVDDEDHDWAAGTLAPVMHPILREKRRQNSMAGLLYVAIAAALFGGLLWLSATGAIPILAGVAMFGFGPVAAVAVGGVAVMVVVAFWMTNLKMGDSLVYLAVGAFVVGAGFVNPVAWPVLLLAVVVWFVADRFVVRRGRR